MATRVLRGAYAYTLQGFEYAGNTEEGQQGELKKVRTGLARGRPREWPENRPLWALPLSDPTAARYPFPYLPETALHSYSGYYPYSETGTMRFNEDQTLSIIFWTNVAGYSYFTGVRNPPKDTDGKAVERGVSSFTADIEAQQGRYDFIDRDPFRPDEDKGFPLPAGVITIWFNFPGQKPDDKFLWDYTFIMISNDEIKLSVAGRLPRPVIATGTMKRMAQNAFPYPPPDAASDQPWL